NTYAVGRVLKGMELNRAKKYLNNVLRHTEAVPFYKFRGGPGRKAAAKQWGGTSQVRYPTKSVYTFLKLLQNAEANAVSKGLEPKKLFISHVI
ncbi:50S ribosomal protein L22, partial [Klebsiella pneumoniae]|nr:50S ribosomal protein L22 [Klebsiella pneumoniae]